MVILVESSNQAPQEVQLLSAIQNIFFTHTVQLQWPCLLHNFQEYENLKYYIEGFMAVHAPKQTLITLGKIDFVHLNVTELPSLKEMIQQPQLKAKLWEHMKR